MNNREKKMRTAFTFMLDDETFELLQKLSLQTGRSKGEVIREALRQEAVRNGMENGTS